MSPFRRAVLLGLALLGGLALTPPLARQAAAHTNSRSYSDWRVTDRAAVAVFTVDSLQVAMLSARERAARPLDAVLADHLRAGLRVTQRGATCPLSEAEPLAAARAKQRMALHFHCTRPIEDAGMHLRLDAFFDAMDGHMHVARFAQGGGLSERVFVKGAQEAEIGGLAAPRGSWRTFAAYIHLGILHILAGLDHLAFVAALVLLSRNFKEMALYVTGFTLGHSLTLSLAALGLIAPNIAVIEALIGFTIAFVAAEALLPPAPAWRRVTGGAAVALLALAGSALAGAGVLPPPVWLGLALFCFCYGRLRAPAGAAAAALWRGNIGLTGIFGLIHGVGFAAVLQEIGLPTERLVMALLGFNLGVEAGQLMVVALALGGIFLARRRLAADLRARGRAWTAAALLALGLFWFVGRAFALA